MDQTSGKPFQFGLSTLLILTAVVAIVVWLAVYHRVWVGPLLFVAGLGGILLLMVLVRVGILWALGQVGKQNEDRSPPPAS